MQAYSKKSLTNWFIFAEKASRPRQQLSTIQNIKRKSILIDFWIKIGLEIE
jgi:hypothetical protein